MQNIFDLYVDYLICSTSYTTATGLSKLTHNAISHDKVTRALSDRDMTSADLWLHAKSTYKNIEDMAIDEQINNLKNENESLRNDMINLHDLINDMQSQITTLQKNSEINLI